MYDVVVLVVVVELGIVDVKALVVVSITEVPVVLVEVEV